MNIGIVAGYPKLVLASASPRRREILACAGLEFEVLAPNISETALPDESAMELVRRLARAKAEVTFAQTRHKTELQNCPVLGADTVVTIGGRILGKPTSSQEATSMIQELAGNAHEVITGVALVFPSASVPIADVRVSSTRVYFRRMTSAQIQEYVLSGEPFDKAGGYGIQGLASKYVERIEGCYFNVVGLPIALVCDMLEEHALRREHT